MSNLNTTKIYSNVKILEGWSTINLSSTYCLCNNLSGQYININRLDIYEQKKNHEFEVNKSFEDLTFGHLKHY